MYLEYISKIASKTVGVTLPANPFDGTTELLVTVWDFTGTLAAYDAEFLSHPSPALADWDRI
jgi:hypothetical protein